MTTDITEESNKPVVLQIGSLPTILEDGLTQHFSCHRLDTHDDPEALLALLAPTCVAIVARGAIGVDATLISKLPNLRIIGNFGVGYEKVDLAAAASRNIVVTNTPDVLTECVADLAFGLLIDVAREITTSDRFVRAKKWPTLPVYPLTSSIHKKKLGIIGLGRIGQAIANRSAGFQMEVRYHNRNPVAGLEANYEASILKLAEWADYLVVAVVGGKTSDGLIGAEVLEALGPKGYLINISRGTVVDEAELIEALINKRIAGAALDVFYDEPNVPNELLGLDNVVLTPHIASGTNETREAMGMLVLNNLLSFLNTGTALTPVPLK